MATGGAGGHGYQGEAGEARGSQQRHDDNRFGRRIIGLGGDRRCGQWHFAGPECAADATSAATTTGSGNATSRRPRPAVRAVPAYPTVMAASHRPLALRRRPA